MAQAKKKKPNILLFMTDQHRADHVGFGGNEIVKTPHLDAIAARSMVFDRAYVANPICMPNRASILTGRVPSSHGTNYNGIPLDWGCNTIARVARKYGYRTGLIGKSHLQNMNDYPEVAQALFANAPKENGWLAPWGEGWAEYERMDRHRREKVEMPADFYGFDDVRLTVYHSDLCSGHYYQWMLSKGADPEALQGSKVALEYNTKTQQIWKTKTPEDLYPTTYIAEETVAFLDDQKDSDAPFFLQCSFPDPHHPFTPPGRYFDMYDPASIPLPDTFWENHETSMPMFRDMIAHRGEQRMFMAPFSPSEDQYRDMAAKQYGMITMIDDAVGQVMAALERNSLADDTIIVFTSDHGDMFGDHGLMLKVGMHYQGCVRVPFTISLPGGTPGRTRSFANSIDLAPTLLEAMGLESYYGIQGTSLMPVLEDPNASVRDYVYVEEDEMFPDPATGQPFSLRTIVTDDGRLTLHGGTPMVGELFDYGSDRGESRNVFADAKAAELRHHLSDRLIETMMLYARPVVKPTAQA